MDSATQAAPQPKRSSRVLPALLLVVVALAALAGVVMMTGGIEATTKLVMNVFAPPPAGAPVASVAATPAVTIDTELGKRMYVEQIESQNNLARLRDGKIASFTVDRVETSGPAATVAITAKFVDGTKAGGVMLFVQKSGVWYFASITGLRSATTGGLADAVGDAVAMEDSETVTEEFKEAGVVTPDPDVMRTLIDQQGANQAIVRALLGGDYLSAEIATPVKGAGTVSLPVKLARKAGGTDTATVVLVTKRVEGKDRVFLTTFKKD